MAEREIDRSVMRCICERRAIIEASDEWGLSSNNYMNTVFVRNCAGRVLVDNLGFMD